MAFTEQSMFTDATVSLQDLTTTHSELTRITGQASESSVACINFTAVNGRGTVVLTQTTPKLVNSVMIFGESNTSFPHYIQTIEVLLTAEDGSTQACDTITTVSNWQISSDCQTPINAVSVSVTFDSGTTNSSIFYKVCKIMVFGDDPCTITTPSLTEPTYPLVTTAINQLIDQVTTITLP